MQQSLWFVPEEMGMAAWISFSLTAVIVSPLGFSICLLNSCPASQIAKTVTEEPAHPRREHPAISRNYSNLVPHAIEQTHSCLIPGARQRQAGVEIVGA